MTKNIKYRVTFTNHTNNKINLNDNIIDVANGSLIYEINKGYINLDFVTNKVYYDPTIIGDNIERIEFKYQIDDNDVQTELFCIEAIEYLSDTNIKVYCRSKSFINEKEYISKNIDGNSLKEILSNLIDNVELNFDNFTDLPFNGSLDIENKSVFDVVDELREAYRFEYYYKQGIIYFCDKKSINKDDESLQRFSEISDIEDFTTSTDLFKKRINKIIINKQDEEVELYKTDLKMNITPTPQNTSPDEILTYTDDNGNIYKMSPQKAQFIIYFTPKKDTFPICNLEATTKEKIIVEKYTLSNESFLKVTAHIKELISIEADSGYTYEIGDNTIIFDEAISGEVKISYKSDVLVGVIENSKYPKDIQVKVTYLDRVIDYIHKIELNNYYPIPYDLTLNTISDWGISADNSIDKDINVSKYDVDDSVFVSQSTIKSDDFGDFILSIQDYGTYKFEMENQEPLFLDYFVNKKEIYMHEIENCE